MKSENRFLFVDDWQFFSWIFLGLGAFSAFNGLISSTLFFLILFDASHSCVELDLKNKTISKFRSLLSFRFFTKTTKPMSEIKRPYSEKSVKKYGNEFMNGEIGIEFNDGTRWKLWFSGLEKRYEQSKNALVSLFDQKNPMSPESTKWLARQQQTMLFRILLIVGCAIASFFVTPFGSR